jgi:hypothetical protein
MLRAARFVVFVRIIQFQRFLFRFVQFQWLIQFQCPFVVVERKFLWFVIQ